MSIFSAHYVLSNVCYPLLVESTSNWTVRNLFMGTPLYVCMKSILGIVIVLLILGASNEYAERRQEMVEKILSRGVTDPETIDALSSVPRHLFVPEDLRSQAYFDYALPIGYGQTISQPYVVALMTASLELEPGHTVLEVGTGSGYQAAVLAEIAEQVYTIEIIAELAEKAEKTLKETGYTNVVVKNADGYFGWEEYQPYDAIIITAAVDHIPPPLLAQLKEGGKLVLPLGNPLYYQTLTLVKKKDNELFTKHITDVRFVPMTGYALGEVKSEKEVEEEVEAPEETIQPEKVTRDNKQVLVGLFVLVFVGLLIVVIWKIKTPS